MIDVCPMPVVDKILFRLNVLCSYFERPLSNFLITKIFINSTVLKSDKNDFVHTPIIYSAFTVEFTNETEKLKVDLVSCFKL